MRQRISTMELFNTPLKQPSTYPELRFSDWLESMRKDVECTFGILKGRFRLLKTGV